MRIFDATLDGNHINDSNNQAKLDDYFDEYCQSVIWSDMNATEQNQPDLSRHVGEYHGIDVWYCHGANYFFFTKVD